MAKKKREEIEETFEPTGEDTSVLSIKSTLNSLFKGTDDIRIDSLHNLRSYIEPKSFISTGDDILDIVISNRKNGGLPMGKYINIFGDSASGKSLFCWKLVANIQKKGGYALYFDTENATYPDFVEVLEVDLNKVSYTSKVKTIGKMFRAISEVMMDRKRRNDTRPFIIVIDSMKAVMLDDVYEDLENFVDTGYQSGAKRQKVLGESLQKVLELIKEENCLFVTVDQVRDNMNKANKYSANSVDTAGNAQKFYADIRLQLQTVEKIKQDSTIIGAKVRTTVIKSRISPSHRSSEFFVYYTRGMDRWASWVENGIKLGVIKSSGAYFKVLDENGEEYRIDGKLPRKSDLKRMIRTNDSLRERLYNMFCDEIIEPYEIASDEDFEELEDHITLEEVRNEEDIDTPWG